MLAQDFVKFTDPTLRRVLNPNFVLERIFDEVDARIAAINAALEVVLVKVEQERHAVGKVGVEVQVLDDVRLVVAIVLVVDGEQFVPLVVHGKVADPVVEFHPLFLTERPGLRHVTLPAVLAVRVSGHVPLDDLREQDLGHREIVDRIHIVAGVDEALGIREQFAHLAELVDVIQVAGVLSGDRLDARTLDERDVIAGVADGMIVTNDHNVMRLLEMLAPTGNSVLKFSALGCGCQVRNYDQNLAFKFDFWRFLFNFRCGHLSLVGFFLVILLVISFSHNVLFLIKNGVGVLFTSHPMD